MTEYIKQSLAADEKLIHIAKFHWMYNVNAFLNVVFGTLLAIVIVVVAIKFQPVAFQTQNGGNGFFGSIIGLHPGIKILAFFVFLMGLLKFAQMMIVKATTEIAITNKRLVYKRGLVARFVGEMNIDRIEGVNVLQGIIGRLFGYGRVMVRGMGVGEVVLPPIQQPIRFRKAIEKARMASPTRNQQN